MLDLHGNPKTGFLMACSILGQLYFRETLKCPKIHDFLYSYLPQEIGRVLGLKPISLRTLTYSPVTHWTKDIPPIPLSSLVDDVLTVMILNFPTDIPEQTVQTQIRQLLVEQSDLGLHCLQYYLKLNCRATLFKFQGNYSNLWVSKFMIF